MLVVSEAYTSKTCGRCGWQHPLLGGAETFECENCGLHIGRDINASRNIYIRAHVDGTLETELHPAESGCRAATQSAQPNSQSEGNL